MILEQLYYGNISPVEETVVPDEEIRQLRGTLAAGMEELSTKLSPEDMELVSKVVDDATQLHCAELKRQFQYGFSLGVLLMKEVCEGASQWWGSGRK